MKNCFNCKDKYDCDFGSAFNTILEYVNDTDGIGTAVKIFIESIEEYVDCKECVM